MEILFYIVVFILGLAVGSFLNCVIYRLEKGDSFLKGRSYCPHCRHILNWQDLIPVFSFLILKGRCRYCKKSISIQYPLVEIATGLLFLLIFNFLASSAGGQFLIFNEFPISNFQTLLNICFLFLIFCFLLIIFVYDLKHYIIPDIIIYPAILIAFLFRILNFGFVWNLGFRVWDFKPILSPILSAIFASFFFLAIILISRGHWMGLGDVKLAFFMGLFLSFPNILVALFFAFLIGAIMGIALILSGKKTLKSEVPFGPFLVGGVFIAFFWGDFIVNWYLSFLM